MNLERPDYLDGILSTQFNECSIVAADTAEKVQQEYSRVSTESETVYFATDWGNHQGNMISFLELGQLGVDHPLVANIPVRLGLAKLDEFEESPTALIGIFNRDLALPIAAFSQRSGGQCSYVQIGQEITEDKLIVTAQDSRQNYVEALREVISKYQTATGNSAKKMVSVETEEKVKELFIREVEANKLYIENLVGQAVGRQILKHMTVGSNRRVVHLSILNDGSQGDFYVAPLTLVTSKDDDLQDGRDTKLLLGHSVYVEQKEEVRERRFRRPKLKRTEHTIKSDSVDLLAEVRGDTALRIATINLLTGVVSLESIDDHASPEQVVGLLEVTDMGQEIHRSYLHNLKNQIRGWAPESNEISLNFASYRILPDIIEGHYSSQYYITAQSNYPSAVRAITENDHKLKDNDIALRAIESQADQNMDSFLEDFDVAKRISDHIGSGTSETEQLLERVLQALGKDEILNIEGELKDRKIGKAQADVHVCIQVQKLNGAIRVHILGRPAVLKGHEMVTIFDEVVSLTTKNQLDEAKAKEISSVLEAIALTDTN